MSFRDQIDDVFFFSWFFFYSFFNCRISDLMCSVHLSWCVICVNAINVDCPVALTKPFMRCRILYCAIRLVALVSFVAYLIKFGRIKCKHNRFGMMTWTWILHIEGFMQTTRGWIVYVECETVYFIGWHCIEWRPESHIHSSIRAVASH